jgi:hypothetical protein
MYAGFDAIRAMTADGSAARVLSGHDPATFGLLGAADDARIATIGKRS